jgi:hypothetical protein
MAVKFTAVPAASPITTNGLPDPDFVCPVEALTVYPVIVSPPFDVGGEKATEALNTPAVATKFNGGVGTVAAGSGVTEFVCTLAGPVPTELIA